MSGSDGFEVLEGGRADEDPVSQDDEDALEALATVIAGPEGEDDPEISARAREQASAIMGMPGTSPGRRPVEGPPA